MNVSYKKLVELHIRHDYYLDSAGAAGESIWPKDYNINNDLDIIPTPECESLMRNGKMIFKSTPTGFVLLITADPNDPGQSLIYIEPSVKLSFLVRIRNAQFMNFTNIPMLTSGRNLFCFQNHTSNKLGATRFMSKPHLLYAAATKNLYGDLVLHNNKILEAIKNDPGDPAPVAARVNCSKPVLPAAAAAWCESSVTDARYVTAQDILIQQGNEFEYSSPNTNPGAVINFTLKDINGQPVSLGNIPNTSTPQSQYTAPTDPAAICMHRIDLTSIAPGKYTMDIKKGMVTETKTFYYLNALLFSNVFGVVELFGGGAMVPADYQFLGHSSTPDGPVSAIQAKTFEIRFKNRVTKREYIRKDGTSLPEKPVAGLSRRYNDFKILTVSMPDPGAALINPKRVSNDPANVDYNKLETIQSEIYLNQ